MPTRSSSTINNGSRTRPRQVAATNSVIIRSFNEYAFSQNLEDGTDEHWEARRRFISQEVRSRFTRVFGADVNSLEGWKKLCKTVLGSAKGKKAINLDELTTIRQCKAKLQNSFVNLIDLVEYAQNGNVLPRRLVFESAEALAEYTKEETKFFPKEDAKLVPLLKRFLIAVFAY
ncbi:hypothetical protein K435DRAFT_721431 [Dendrothele bispora CBS 962.96]|uniref:Uncharacterized protein n=1 Tax=Dendrothele bispora (strain CBS 962.96) TaxID=1314807 RepID=A0A4S8M642_DENBC|nr:hypothetical protein K435DRAFT_721431 [Dendrothele bispora CBS 962.96]